MEGTATQYTLLGNYIHDIQLSKLESIFIISKGSY